MGELVLRQELRAGESLAMDLSATASHRQKPLLDPLSGGERFPDGSPGGEDGDFELDGAPRGCHGCSEALGSALRSTEGCASATILNLRGVGVLLAVYLADSVFINCINSAANADW